MVLWFSGFFFAVVGVRVLVVVALLAGMVVVAVVVLAILSGGGSWFWWWSWCWLCRCWCQWWSLSSRIVAAPTVLVPVVVSLLRVGAAQVTLWPSVRAPRWVFAAYLAGKLRGRLFGS